MKYKQKVIIKFILRILLLKVNYKTIYFNLKYLPINQAIEFPIIISSQTYFRKTKGKLILNSEKLNFGMIKIGFYSVGIFDEKKSRTIWENNGTIVFNGSARIGHGSKISVGKNAKLIFGNKFTITAETALVSQTHIEFGDDCLLSWDNLIMDTDFHDIIDIKTNKKNNRNKPIIIGNNVWIGCRSLILKGSLIPDNTVIAANSLLSKKLIDKNSIYAGNPIQKIKENIRWK